MGNQVGTNQWQKYIHIIMYMYMQNTHTPTHIVHNSPGAQITGVYNIYIYFVCETVPEHK